MLSDEVFVGEIEMQSSEKWGENSGRTTPHTSKENSDDEGLMLWGE